MSETKKGGFNEWYNQPKILHAVQVVYSLGAAVVIIGALFKILHWPFASYILSIGMFTEAFLFALSALERPFKSYAWDRIFDFKTGKPVSQLAGGAAGVIGGGVAGALHEGSGRSVSLNYSETISDDEVLKLTDGIKNLSATAKQLTVIGESVKNTGNFAQSVEIASKAANEYVVMQNTLNTATQKLSNSYENAGKDVDNLGKEVDNLGRQMSDIGQNTKLYQDKIDGINKNLASINAVYEVHLKNAQTQTDALNNQTDRVNAVSKEMEVILANVQKSTAASESLAKDTEKYKQGTALLAKQVADLNNVYGNMLNALS
ncbi:MAG: gliding motility protein GldL [Paludibacter sp.]|nr:gliding motility protein GldL [Paludibacter sp.]